MNKKKYLRKLRKALGRIPESEKEELIEYYAEIIDESYERGKTTREIFATIETPEQVAADYFNGSEGCIREERSRPVCAEYFTEDYDRPASHGIRRERSVQSRPPKKKRSALLTLLLLPLYIVGFVLALALCIVCVSAVICVIACEVSGLYVFVMSFGLFAAHGTLAVTQIGVAIALFGISVFFVLAIKPLARGTGALFRVVFHRPQRDGSLAQTHWIGLFVTGLLLLIVGGGMGGFGYSALGGDWHNLAAVGNVVVKEERVELSSGEIALRSDNLRVSVFPAEEGEAKIVYYETDELPLEYAVEEGVLTVKCGEWGKGGYWKETFHRGIMFPTVVSSIVKAELYLPAEYEGALSLAVGNGALTVGGFQEGAEMSAVTLATDNGMLCVDGIQAQKLSLNTDNGYIELKNVCTETLEFSVDNGAVKINGVKAQTVSGSTRNGAIILDKLEGDDVSLETNNGAITGTLVGSEEEFQIQAEVSLGSCNLQNKLDGLKRLWVKTDNGSIRVSFVPALVQAY